MEALIETIKSDFRSEIGRNDSKVIKLYKLRGDLFNLTNQTKLFDYTPKDKAEWEKRSKTQLEIEALEKRLKRSRPTKSTKMLLSGDLSFWGAQW